MKHLNAGFGPQVNGLIGSRGELRWQIAIRLCLTQAGCCAGNEAGIATTRIKSDFVAMAPSAVHPWGSLTPSIGLSPPSTARRGCDTGTQRGCGAECAVPLPTQLDPPSCWNQRCAAKINGAHVNTENFPAELGSPGRESNCSAMLELWPPPSCSPSRIGLAGGQSSSCPIQRSPGNFLTLQLQHLSERHVRIF